MKTINDRLIDELLVKRNLTTYKISKDLTIAVQTVDSWLKGIEGKFPIPKADKIAEMCELYGLDAEFILLGKHTIKNVQNIPQAEGSGNYDKAVWAIIESMKLAMDGIKEDNQKLKEAHEKLQKDHYILKGEVKTLEKVVVLKKQIH